MQDRPLKTIYRLKSLKYLILHHKVVFFQIQVDYTLSQFYKEPTQNHLVSEPSTIIYIFHFG